MALSIRFSRTWRRRDTAPGKLYQRGGNVDHNVEVLFFSTANENLQRFFQKCSGLHRLEGIKPIDVFDSRNVRILFPTVCVSRVTSFGRSRP